MDYTCRGRKIFCEGLFIAFLFFLTANPVFSQSTTDSYLKHQIDSAEVLSLLKDYRSTALCRNVFIEARKLNNPKIQARALNALSDIHRSFSEYDSAKKYLEQANEIILRNKLTEDIEYARNLFYTGKLLRSVHAGDLHHFQDSILMCYSRAWNLYETAQSIDYNFQADMLYSMGFFQQKLSKLDEANEYYAKLIQLLNTHFDQRDYRRGTYLYLTALHFINIGDYQRSLILSQIASYIFRSEDFPDFKRYMNSEWLIANNYYNSEQYREAADQYKKVIEILQEKSNDYSSILIELYTNICQPLIYLQQYDQAIEYAVLAVESTKHNAEYADIMYYMYNNLAEAYEKKGEDKNAEMYFKKSIALRLELFEPGNEEIGLGYMYYGDYFRGKGNYPEALACYQMSMGEMFPDVDPKDIYDNPNFENYTNIEQLLYILFRKAGSFYKLYEQTNDLKDLQISYSIYQTIYQLTDKLLNGNYLDKSSMQIFQRFDDELLMSIDCASLLYEITADQQYLEQSFQFIEKNKYFLLRKALSNAQGNAGNNDNFPSKSNKAFASEIGKLQQAINNTSDADRRFDLQNELLSIYNEKDMLYPQKPAENNMSVSEEKNTISIADAQRLVTSDSELLIEYHWSTDRVYAFVIGRNSADIIKIEISDDLLQAVSHYADALSGKERQKVDFKTFTASAYMLYKSLIKPIEEHASVQLGNSQISRFIIVPDGPLSTLPFEAFISVPDSISGSYWGLDYLCKKYIISYAYSLNILKNNFSRSREKRKPSMLAMSYSAIPDKNSMENPESENELPYSVEEIISLKKHLETTAYLGQEATENVFKSTANEYSIIHLAIHGQADTTDMFNSRLIFRKDGDPEEDGELHVFELYDLDLSRLDLAVLSACETGIGKSYEGEGIFSIARGFAFAGCPSVIMSLWKVNDKTTAALMDYFYSNLKENVPTDEALRNAKLSFINNADDLSAHPANWAAFIALGNNQPVQLPQSKHFYQYILFAAGIILLVLIYVKRKSLLHFFK